jgi:hypothetical protein
LYNNDKSSSNLLYSIKFNMGYDDDKRKPVVDSYEVDEETGDGNLRGKRGGKPFYKQTWFLWSESEIYSSNETYH